MEADLARYYNIDIRDRWRRDDRGVRLLTLRRLRNLLVNLPPDAALMPHLTGGLHPMTRLEQMVDDVRLAVLAAAGAKKHDLVPHPDRARLMREASKVPATADRHRREMDLRRRRRAREQALRKG